MRAGGSDGDFDFVPLDGSPTSEVTIEFTETGASRPPSSDNLVQNQLAAIRAAAKLHGEISGTNWKARARQRCYDFWYAEKGRQFALAEALKITLSVVSYYGVVSYGMWDNCDMPATSNQAKCDFNYDNLRLYEIGALTALFVITGLLRQQRRKLELTPALNLHSQFARRWRDMSQQSDCDLTANIDELYQLHSTTPLQDKLRNLEVALTEVEPKLESLNQGVHSYRQISLNKSCYSTLDRGIRVGVSGFLGFNLGMQFLLMLSTLSKRDDFEWHGSDLSELGFIGWCTVLFSVAVVFHVIPDDLSTQTNDINHKTVRQYELIANSCLDKKNTIGRQLLQCWNVLCSIEKDCVTERCQSPGPELEKIQEIKSRIAGLNAKANAIAIPESLLAEKTRIVKVGAVRRLTPPAVQYPSV
ncbi:MAG: hypothetical protein P1U34_06275 [Coxiellaceae bacterium]|nr:hypothetical protein [Coxiellaceae bacterium]